MISKYRGLAASQSFMHASLLYNRSQNSVVSGETYLGSLVYPGMIAALSLSFVMAYPLVNGSCSGLN